jgi:hypothetical protein
VSNSKRGILLALIGALVLYSCGLDGGSRGTGITSLAQGNVASVQPSASVGPPRDRNSVRFAQSGDFLRTLGEASAASTVQGITVTVEPQGGQSATDSAGLFSVRGSFEGQLTLLFTRPQDAIRASIEINIPAGGALTLNNVRISTASGIAMVDSENVDFLGNIVGVNCTSQTLILIASQHAPSDTDTYTVRLDTSSLRDPQSKPVSCADLRNGQMAHVQGTVNADGSFGHALVVVD